MAKKAKSSKKNTKLSKKKSFIHSNRMIVLVILIVAVGGAIIYSVSFAKNLGTYKVKDTYGWPISSVTLYTRSGPYKIYKAGTYKSGAIRWAHNPYCYLMAPANTWSLKESGIGVKGTAQTIYHAGDKVSLNYIGPCKNH